MYEEVHEKVKVRADFDFGKITPLLIKWRNRDFKVAKINLVSQERDGQSLNYYFAVETDSGNCFKLKYNDKDLIWLIEESWVE